MTASQKNAPTLGRARAWALAALLLAIHAALAVHSLWVKSIAGDELSHLPAGMAAVATGKIVLNPQHPPLVKLMAGAAALTADSALPLEGRSYRERDEWEFGREVFHRPGQDQMRLLRRARLPMVALSLAAGVAVFLWSSRRCGWWAGLFSLGLYALSPTVLAHARWVTMDVAVAAGSVWTMYCWRQACRSHRRTLWVLSGVVLGLAMCSKFSALILLPCMFCCDLLANGWQGGWRSRILRWLVVGASALLVIVLVYHDLEKPLRYFQDLTLVYTDHDPDYEFYLAGGFRQGGFPLYFPTAFLVKTALPGLLAMLAGIALALARRNWTRDGFLLIPLATWWAVNMAMAANIGVRYLLPVYPLTLILAGDFYVWLRRTRLHPVRWLPAILLLLQLGEVGSAHPDYLPYFNQLAGGPRGGLHWLDDSNVDWGQDLYRLPGWLEENNVEKVRLIYFGNGDPNSFGVPLEVFPMSDFEVEPRPGYYLISAQALIRGMQQHSQRGVLTDWIRRYEPVDDLGHTLYLFAF